MDDRGGLALLHRGTWGQNVAVQTPCLAQNKCPLGSVNFQTAQPSGRNFWHVLSHTLRHGRSEFVFYFRHGLTAWPWGSDCHFMSFHLVLALGSCFPGRPATFRQPCSSGQCRQNWPSESHWPHAAQAELCTWEPLGPLEVTLWISGTITGRVSGPSSLGLHIEKVFNKCWKWALIFNFLNLLLFYIYSFVCFFYCSLPLAVNL